ncbi:MAG: hypothetical protein JWP90_2122 [Mycetocola sp.]|nr:hypothetical protein [Mycetocola sp.]
MRRKHASITLRKRLGRRSPTDQKSTHAKQQHAAPADRRRDRCRSRARLRRPRSVRGEDTNALMVTAFAADCHGRPDTPAPQCARGEHPARRTHQEHTGRRLVRHRRRRGRVAAQLFGERQIDPRPCTQRARPACHICAPVRLASCPRRRHRGCLGGAGLRESRDGLPGPGCADRHRDGYETCSAWRICRCRSTGFSPAPRHPFALPGSGSAGRRTRSTRFRRTPSGMSSQYGLRLAGGPDPAGGQKRHLPAGTALSTPLCRHRSGHGSPGGRSDEPTKTPAEPRVRPRGAFLPHCTTAFEDMF